MLKETPWDLPGGTVDENPPADGEFYVMWLKSHIKISQTQGTWVQSLIQEDYTCCGATKPVHHNHWASTLEPSSRNYWAHVPQLPKPVHTQACGPQQEKPPLWEAHKSQWGEAPTHGNQRKPAQSNEDPASKIK